MTAEHFTCGVDGNFDGGQAQGLVCTSGRSTGPYTLLGCNVWSTVSLQLMTHICQHA
jgi:hypothetical protein